MTPSNEERIIQQKLKELSGLVEQRDLIQAKIDKTEAAISAFIALLEDELDQEIYSMRLKIASKPLGLTEAIKRIFIEAQRKGEALLPGTVKDRLTESGFPIASYSNPHAVIYTTLTRLRDQGLIEEAEKENGIFKWVAKETTKFDAMEKVLRTTPMAPRIRNPKKGIGHRIAEIGNDKQ